MPPMEMFEALRAVTFHDCIQVLEIGGGAGTRTLVRLLRKKNVSFTYIVYEDDPKYVVDEVGVHTVLWHVFPKKLEFTHTYDLVIVDGPKGVIRQRWYPLLKTHVRAGTIMAIDDFGHFPEFGRALDENFIYSTVAEYEPQSRRGVTWRVVKILGTK